MNRRQVHWTWFACAVLTLWVTPVARSGLVLDLRFPDGSTEKDVTNAGPSVTTDIDIWAIIEDGDSNPLDDGLNSATYGIRLWPKPNDFPVGVIIDSRLPDDFDESGSRIGWTRGRPRPGDPPIALLPDDIILGGGIALNWQRASAGDAGTATVFRAGNNFKIGSVSFRLDLETSYGYPPGRTTVCRLDPLIPDFLSSTLAMWKEDEMSHVPRLINGQLTYRAGASVTFYVLPEPKAMCLLAAGALLLVRCGRAT